MISWLGWKERLPADRNVRRDKALPGKNRVDRGQQVGGDRSCENHSIGSCGEQGRRDRGLVVDAEQQQFRGGRAFPKRAQETRRVAPRERQVDHDHLWPKPFGAFHQRALVRDHEYLVESRLEQSANAFAESVMPVGKQYAIHHRFPCGPTVPLVPGPCWPFAFTQRCEAWTSRKRRSPRKFTGRADGDYVGKGPRPLRARRCPA